VDKIYPAHVWLMIFYGFLDSMWQTYAYWLIGAVSNNPAKLASVRIELEMKARARN
jgi:hypothetical protein